METKILIRSREKDIRTRIKIKGDQIIEQVNNFIYLESTISSDGIGKKEMVNMPCQGDLKFKS